MIREVEGDILKSESQVIVHGIAPMDHMDQGLALALHEKYPTMHRDFHHWCHQQSPKPGEAWMWGGPGGVRVVNLITQAEGKGHGSHPRRAELSDVNHALRALRKMIAKEGFESIALPRLATGVGGLDWADVRPLIQKHLGDLDVPVELYVQYVKEQVARSSS